MPALVTTNIANATANGVLNSIDWMVPIINDMDPQGGSLQRSAYSSWLSGAPAGGATASTLVLSILRIRRNMLQQRNWRHSHRNLAEL
jgi:hypothetical protein